MSRHPSSQLLDQYNQRKLPSDVFLQIHRHILSCPQCAEKCHQPERLRADYAALRSALLPAPDEEGPSHLSMTEAESYLKHELGEIDLEIAESHLEVCVQCRASVRRLKRKGSATPASTPVSGAAATEGAGGAFRTPAVWHGGWRLRHVAALSAGIILFLVGLALISTRMSGPRRPAAPPVEQDDSARNPVPKGNRPNPQEPAVSEIGNGNHATENSTARDGVIPSSSPARKVLVINDGGRKVVLDSRVELSGLENLDAGLRQEIKRMLLTGKVRMPSQPAELNGERATLLSYSSDDGLPFRLTSPLSKIISDNRPTFRWEPLSGAESYTVTVVDAQLNEVAVSEPVKSNRWKIHTPLRYGGIYSWQVTAIREGAKITSPVLPAPQAKFKVLADDKMKELRRLREASAGSRLPLAAFYIRVGMIDEAQKELRALVHANPQAPVLLRLLKSLRS